jgi:ABC-type proline/glycine betaine transport system ATPase subunit
LISIIQRTDRQTEKILLESIEERDPKLAESIRANLFLFEDIANIDNRSLQLVLREVSPQDLALSLKGVSQEVHEKVLSNLSTRAADMLEEELELMGRVRRSNVEEAQGKIVAVIRRLAKDGMTMVIVTHEMDFARDVANRIFYMDEGLIYEEGSPAQIFENPQKEKTRIFIHRVRSWRHEVLSRDYDLYAMNGQIETFCEKQMLGKTARHNLLLLLEEILQLYKSVLGQIRLSVSVEYSEKTEQLELSFTSNSATGNLLESDNPDDELPILIIRNHAEQIHFESVDGAERLQLVVKRS